MKPVYDVRLVGRATSDSELRHVGAEKRPICEFRMMVSSGKDKKTNEYMTPFWFDVACWGDRARGIKKGMDVELFGYVKRSEYMKNGEKQTRDTVTVKTDEAGEPQINYEGIPSKTRHLSDEAVAKSVGSNKKLPSLEQLGITDEDLPF
jgi:single-stranded DNA-binding protein